jgi:hypothetical protein
VLIIVGRGPPFFNEINGFNTLFLRFGSIAVVCLLAIASWKLFESPIIRLGNRLTDRTRTSVTGVQDTEAGPVALRELPFAKKRLRIAASGSNLQCWRKSNIARSRPKARSGTLKTFAIAVLPSPVCAWISAGQEE